MSLVPILLYHSVSEAPPPWIAPYSITPETFVRHLEAVASSGVTPLPLARYSALLAAGDPLPERAVVLTFDDGLADFGEHALPALDAARLPATLFVTTGFLDGVARNGALRRPQGPWLHASDVVALHDAGVEIGAHSHSHPQLDTLSTAAAAEEVGRPKRILEALLGAPVTAFAYPHGYHGPRVREQVRAAGYATGCAVKNAFSSERDDPFALARLTVHADTTAAELSAWLEGRGASPAPERERLRTRGWRGYRRARALARGLPGSELA